MYLPLITFLFPLSSLLKDNADGKEVIDPLEVTFLFLHFLPDRVYRLSAPLDMEFQSCCCQTLADRLDETLDIGITTFLRSTQFLLDMIICIMLQIFQRQVLQLRLHLIESQLVGKRRIEIGSLLTHLPLRFHLFRITYLAHQVHTVGNHDQDNAHILCKRKQQVTEILCLHDWILLIELLDTLKSVEDTRDGVTKDLPHLLNGQMTILYTRMQQHCQHGITLQSDLLYHQLSRLEGKHDGIEPEHITMCLALLYIIAQILSHLILITFFQ